MFAYIWLVSNILFTENNFSKIIHNWLYYYATIVNECPIDMPYIICQESNGIISWVTERADLQLIYHGMKLSHYIYHFNISDSHRKRITLLIFFYWLVVVFFLFPLKFFVLTDLLLLRHLP